MPRWRLTKGAVKQKGWKPLLSWKSSQERFLGEDNASVKPFSKKSFI